MPSYKRRGDGTRLPNAGSGSSGAGHPGSWLSPTILIGDKETRPAYLGEYRNGYASEAEKARLDEMTARK